MKISVAMIVKNEESCLRTCLESVKTADEIVIVDTGSTDKTKEIAAEYTDKIYDFVWCDNFALARNEVHKYVTGDWLLTIDADEVLEPGGIQKIRDRIDEKFKTLEIQIVSKIGEQVHYQPRVYKKDPNIFWKGAVHNYLNIVEDNKTDIKIVYGYSEAHKKDPDRALRILKKEVEKNPHSAREKYYLAREYWYRKMWADAIHWYLEYLKIATWLPEIADAHLMLARCFWQMRMGHKARYHCLQAIGLNPQFKEAFLFMSEITWPEQGQRWKEMGESASNKDVLFVRV